jgi:hypothetical protein
MAPQTSISYNESGAGKVAIVFFGKSANGVGDGEMKIVEGAMNAYGMKRKEREEDDDEEEEEEGEEASGSREVARKVCLNIYTIRTRGCTIKLINDQ